MVKYQAALDRTFQALADPTRRAILERLARGEAAVGELAEPFHMSLPAISKHLWVLERAGLLSRERHGRIRRCCLTAGPMKDAAYWIARYQAFWEARFNALARYLGEARGKETRAWKREPRRPPRRSGSHAPLLPPGSRSSRPGRSPRR